MASSLVTLPAAAPQADVVAAVRALNADARVHGILVQLPLPPQVDEAAVLAEISVGKDVDGLHPANIGALGMRGRTPLFTPATPTGVMHLLAAADVPLRGASAVVLGRSNIVGLPMALLLLNADATVTVCHSRTRDLPSVLRGADVVVAALGQPHFVQAGWLKPGAAVIDVGTNRVDDPADPRGYRLVGDVDFDGARQVAGLLTPSPGGVGPMTIAVLLANTVRAAELAAGG